MAHPIRILASALYSCASELTSELTSELRGGQRVRDHAHQPWPWPEHPPWSERRCAGVNTEHAEQALSVVVPAHHVDCVVAVDAEGLRRVVQLRARRRRQSTLCIDLEAAKGLPHALDRLLMAIPRVEAGPI